MARTSRFATEFPSADGVLVAEGFSRRRSRYVRRRHGEAFEAFDVVEAEWSTNSMGYRFQVGVVVPLIERALGNVDADAFNARATLLGGHVLGGQRWPQLGLSELWIPGIVTSGEADDRTAASVLERLAFPWFDRLELRGLARSRMMWDPYALLLLHLLGELGEAIDRLAQLDRDAVTGTASSEWSRFQAARARDALRFLANESGDD